MADQLIVSVYFKPMILPGAISGGLEVIKSLVFRRSPLNLQPTISLFVNIGLHLMRSVSVVVTAKSLYFS